MRLKRYGSADTFWREVAPFLLANEAENHLIISIARTLIEDPARYEDPYLAAGLNRTGSVCAVALMTPPHNLLLDRCDEEFMESVLLDLGARLATVRGVTGPDDIPKRLCEMVADSGGRAATPAMALRTFKLSCLNELPVAAGRFDCASAPDRKVLASMISGFEKDARADVSDGAQRTADRLIDEKLLYVWRDEADAVVSMAGTATGTPHGKRIGWVYTPPHLRGRGYASSVVAELSRHILESGKQFCFLFTDLSNPVSNRIYRRIGYEPICDFNDYRFEEEKP
jgi:predicted GNAT family acetyltransferase